MGLFWASRYCSVELRLFMVSLMVLGIHATCPSVCDCRSGGTVDCEGKNLATIPGALPVNTKYLYLHYNKLTKLEANAFSGLQQLLKLHLYNNEILEIEDGAFHGLPKLKMLDLTSNNISIFTNRTLEGMPNFEKLLLGNNHLSSLPSGVFSPATQLLELELSRNNLHELPADVFRDLSNIETLDLSNNSASLLQTPIFRQMATLQHLKLNDLSMENSVSVEDLISESAFNGLLNLRKLDLIGNSLTKIPTAVKFLPNLTAVSFYLNSIQSVNADDFHQPSLIKWLDLEFNSLAEIPTSALAEFPHLTDLYLSYNPIPMIPPLAFLHNPRLARLSVGYTNLTTIDKEGFVGLGQLDTLDLSGNNLTTIVDGAMNHVNPEVNLELVGNPLRCDCHLRGFADWLINNHTGTLNRGSSLKCVTPDRLNSTAVTDLLPNQFACQPRSTSSIITVSEPLESDVSLPCAIDADPALQIYWITNNHEEISSKQSQPPFTIADDGSLLVTSISLSNEGFYTCKVSNDAGEAKSSVELSVLPLHEKNNALIISICVASGFLFLVVVLVFIWKGTRDNCFMCNEATESLSSNEHVNRVFEDDLSLSRQRPPMPTPSQPPQPPFPPEAAAPAEFEPRNDDGYEKVDPSLQPPQPPQPPQPTHPTQPPSQPQPPQSEVPQPAPSLPTSRLGNDDGYHDDMTD